MATASATRISPADQRASEAFESLRGKHRLEISDVARDTGLSRSKLYRRRDDGGWTHTEIAVLSAYFGVPIAVFSQGPLDISDSHIDAMAARAELSKLFHLAA